MGPRSILAVLVCCAALSACGFKGAYTAERVAITGPARVEAPQLEVGRSWSYRLVNGYNSETVSQYREEVIESSAAGLSIARIDVDRDTSIAERYTPDWKWISKARPGFGPIEYAPPLIAIPFPLEVGKSWRYHTVTNNPQTGERYTIDVYGRVAGWEKIKTADKTYDAIRIVRETYVNDSDQFKTKTEIREADWYAPSVGRVVRSENTSGYYDVARTSREGALWIAGDWNVLELVDTSAAQRP